jgi:hypothetical protein
MKSITIHKLNKFFFATLIPKLATAAAFLALIAAARYLYQLWSLQK